MMSISKYLENGGRNDLHRQSSTSQHHKNKNNNGFRLGQAPPQSPGDDQLSVWTEDVEQKNANEHNNGNDEAVAVTAGFAMSHPRQRRLVTRRKDNQTTTTTTTTTTSPPSSTAVTRSPPVTLPTDPLSKELWRFEQHVPWTTSAQRDWDRVQDAFRTLATRLEPPKTLHVTSRRLRLEDPVPSSLRQPWKHRHVYLHKATYEANDPTEDRSTVVVGEDFVFAGVWDGHGGVQCSEFTQNVVFDNFNQAYQEYGATTESQGTAAAAANQRVPASFVRAFQKTNRDYYLHARAQNVRQAYFAGTCAVACFLDFSESAGGAPKTPSSGDNNNNHNTATLYCANLGDSRAVLGTLQRDGTFTAQPLSVDHTAENLLERQRIQALHPHDGHVVVDLAAPSHCGGDDTTDHDTASQQPQQSPTEPPDWRVKGIAAFTRSIGDLQLKEKNTSALFNSYLPPPSRVLPRPGIVHKHTDRPTPPYISTDAEVQQVQVPGMSRYDLTTSTTSPSFIIIACDGVWDEMTTEEAVDCVGDLLSQYPNKKEVDIANMFIEKVLEQVVERLRETDEDEKDLTLHELKQRPKGKETDQSRSLLHDDITVVIIQLGSSKAFYRGRRGRSGRGLGGRNASVTSLKSLQKAMLRKNAHRTADPMRAIQERLQKNDPDRVEKDKQIVNMMDFFDGMNIRHLKILFHALDVDGNGTLDREEIERLINQVMLTNVSADVVDLAFEEMDADGSGAVDFLEFVSFFGHHQDGKDDEKDDTDTMNRRFSLL